MGSYAELRNLILQCFSSPKSVPSFISQGLFSWFLWSEDGVFLWVVVAHNVINRICPWGKTTKGKQQRKEGFLMLSLNCRVHFPHLQAIKIGLLLQFWPPVLSLHGFLTGVCVQVKAAKEIQSCSFDSPSQSNCFCLLFNLQVVALQICLEFLITSSKKEVVVDLLHLGGNWKAVCSTRGGTIIQFYTWSTCGRHSINICEINMEWTENFKMPDTQDDNKNKNISACEQERDLL